MVGRWVYDAAYRWWAPWDGVGVRDDLRRLLDAGDVTPDRHPRAIDLGCGTGANVVHLAERGFDATGIDFSPVAVAQARDRAADAGVADRCRFVVGDLTAERIAGVDGPYDLLVDFGVLDDLRHGGRRAMARTIRRLSRPGSVLLLWCFYAPRQELPRISFSGPSRIAPAIEPGEETRLFGDDFDIAPVHVRRDGDPVACFVLTRRPPPADRPAAATPGAIP